MSLNEKDVISCGCGEKESCCESSSKESICCGSEKNKHSEHSHEGCSCSCSCGHSHEKDKSFIKKGILRIVLGGVFLGLGIFLEKFSLPFFILSYIIFGYDVVINAVKSILKGKALDEHFLMAFATICAFCLGEYVEAVAVMLFYQVGEFLQGAVVNSSRKSIKGLMEMQIEYANVLEGDKIYIKKPEEIKIGDTIVIKPGEKVAIDGVITKGKTTFDMAALTGEAIPVEKGVGDSVLSGSINNGSVVYIKAEKDYKNSTVARIMDMVENASKNKARAENFITKFAKVYTPIVVVLAILVAIIPTFMGYDFSSWLYRALIFLVASCPCALVLSVPLTFFAGIGTMSRHGVLVKGGNYLENLSNTDLVVLDKTGTITEGKFTVKDFSSEDAMKYAISLERFSTHPIALALVECYKGEFFEAEKVENITGFGMSGYVKGKKVLVGSEKLMEKEGIKVERGKSIYVAVEKEFMGYINIDDSVKKDSKDAISKIKKIGVKAVYMLTGDKKEIGDKVGNYVGVDRVYAELLPDGKVQAIEKAYKDGYKCVLAVGDGINDAPVLARADVGVAMGGIGSDAAIEAADVVIMNDSLTKLELAIKLAKKTMKICRQNVAIVIGLKVLVLLITILGFSNMWIAVFSDVGVAMIAVINAIRIVKI